MVIIGSTAPSLHDIHPTPLAANHSGVDALATAIDSALNQRHLAELPSLQQAHEKLAPALNRLAQRSGEVVLPENCADRRKLANRVLQAWSKLQNSDTSLKARET